MAGELEWGVAARALPGEAESGDSHIVKPIADGWLVAVADGLGHGPDAATASRVLLSVLDGYSSGSLVDLVRRCHERLRATRGLAISLAAINAEQETLTWIGVGNVEGLVRHAGDGAEYITLRGGIVGYRLPELHPSVVRLRDGDLLVLATDGIREGFAEAVSNVHPPQLLADRILAAYARPNDDALVLAARWRADGRDTT